MTTIADYTSPGLILPQLRSRDAATIIGELSSTLQREGRLNDLLPFYNAVMNRELLSSTAISPGWAMPHARIKGLDRVSFALGRSRETLNWFGRASEGVQVVFLFAVPETDATDYMALISGLARLSQDAVRQENLLRAFDSQAMFDVLRQIPLRQLYPAATKS